MWAQSLRACLSLSIIARVFILSSVTSTFPSGHTLLPIFSCSVCACACVCIARSVPATLRLLTHTAAQLTPRAARLLVQQTIC